MRRSSPTGQKYRQTSIRVEADADIADLSTLDLVDELLDRARDGDTEARAWVNEAPGKRRYSPDLDHLQWEDVERALIAKDFDMLARWLWPQVRANYPRPPFVPIDTSKGQTDAR